ncbi:MAG: hypothetical protein ACREI3_10250 [Nitrospirales bacterium]
MDWAWGYWGIISGLLAMLTVFFISDAILYRPPESQATEEAGKGEGEKKEAAPAAERYRKTA